MAWREQTAGAVSPSEGVAPLPSGLEAYGLEAGAEPINRLKDSRSFTPWR